MEASPEVLTTILALVAGISLSASCVPPLIVSLAAMLGFVDVGESFEWMATWQAALAFGVASLFEFAAYYIPAVDNLLDTIAVPLSAVAGTVLTASLFTGDIPPAVQWVLAAVAGGGTAVAVSSGTSAIRGASTVTTAGLGNGLVSTGELGASVGLSIVTIVQPILGRVLAVIVVVVAFSICRRVKRRLAGEKQPETAG